MNILITGGAGFIGSNLCKVLVLNGHNVTCVDNFYTGSIENIVFRDLPADDPKKRNPDISKMKNEFSWIPLINLENGLLKTIQYFCELLKRG